MLQLDSSLLSGLVWFIADTRPCSSFVYEHLIPFENGYLHVRAPSKDDKVELIVGVEQYSV